MRGQLLFWLHNNCHLSFYQLDLFLSPLSLINISLLSSSDSINVKRLLCIFFYSTQFHVFVIVFNSEQKSSASSSLSVYRCRPRRTKTMGAQQVKEGRGGGIGSNTTTGLNSIVSANNGTATINSNCSSITSSVSGTSTFGAGSSLRASRMHKPKTPKEAKTPIGLNIFTEHNGEWTNTIFFFFCHSIHRFHIFAIRNNRYINPNQVESNEFKRMLLQTTRSYHIRYSRPASWKDNCLNYKLLALHSVQFFFFVRYRRT